MGVVMRIDDVNPNTDFRDFDEQLKTLSFVADEIILGINIFGKESMNGAIYPELPLRGHQQDYFYNVDRSFPSEVLFELRQNPLIKIASHGLVHAEHHQIHRDAAALSMVVSCSFLNTRLFIPPFNEVSDAMRVIAADQGIKIIGNSEGKIWKSLESEPFDPNHKFWYYHPWRLNASKLKEAINAGCPV